MNLRFLRRFLQSAAFIFVALVSKDALAYLNDCTAPLPLSVTLPSVAVPSNLPVGQPIPGGRASFSIPINCTADMAAGLHWNLTTTNSGAITLVNGYTDVYTAPGMNAGVGFRMRGADGSVIVPINYSGTFNTYDMGPANKGSNRVSGSFELVRTANTMVSGNAIFPMYLHVPSTEWANGGTGALSTINFGYTLQPTTVAACTVTQSSVNVAMPSTGARSLSTVGATAGNAPFFIDLNCESGAKPQISLGDATTPSNQTTDLSLAPGSTASGVGVQVLYGASPVTFAPAPYTSNSSGTLTPNLINLGPRSGVTHVPFSARYVRNSASLTPGSVKALAIFTMLYQ